MPLTVRTVQKGLKDYPDHCKIYVRLLTNGELIAVESIALKREPRTGEKIVIIDFE